jgi:hypothetical protein
MIPQSSVEALASAQRGPDAASFWREARMGFDEECKHSDGHPISEETARALMAGELGEQYFAILAQTCSPLYWHAPNEHGQSEILHNGTLTYVQGRDGIFGVTAAHVVKGYLADASRPGCMLQLGNAKLELQLIEMDEQLDIATLAIPGVALRQVGKGIAPVSLPRPHDEPQEGRGIMLCGFPGEDRRPYPGNHVSWGAFGAVGISRRVNQRQITWSPDHEHHVPLRNVPVLERNKNLGGISGGPLIAWFEKAGGLLSYYSLAGVIVQAEATLENVVARRAEYIRPDGKLRPFN